MSITDAGLDRIIENYQHEFPQAEEAMLRDHLQSLGMHVRERLRISMQRLFGSEKLMAPPISRRTYSVPRPNALWHIDGNHKMIHWQLVIPGCIDRFPFVVTFLQCSNNNRAETVLESFVLATQGYGIPSRVRSDFGGENVSVWEFMEEIRGYNRTSYIAGSSVHNTQIKRLWRDVCTAVSSTYIHIFTELDEQGMLDPMNDADLFCLHVSAM